MARIEAVLRDTKDEDMPRVRRFYESAPEKDLKYLRLHLEDHRLAIEKGCHFIVEIDGRIEASTMISLPPPGQIYAEAGNTLVPDDRYKGYGLQRFFLKLRAAALTEHPNFILTTGVNPDNEDSYRNVCSSGEFSRWDDEDVPGQYYDLCKENRDEKRTECRWRAGALGKGRICCCDFFRVEKDSQRRLVRSYLDELKGRSFLDRQKRGCDPMRLALKTRWAVERDLLDDLQDFAEGR